MLHLGDLSSCPDSCKYYQNVLLNLGTSPKITCLRLVIDKGVINFVLLGEILREKFPNLEELELHQNHSSCDGKTSGDIKHDFISFLKMMNLKGFEFHDVKSEFIRLMSVDEFFSAMKEFMFLEVNLGNGYSSIAGVYERGMKTLKVIANAN